jgi:hypothetical protein
LAIGFVSKGQAVWLKAKSQELIAVPVTGNQISWRLPDKKLSRFAGVSNAEARRRNPDPELGEGEGTRIN